MIVLKIALLVGLLVWAGYSVYDIVKTVKARKQARKNINNKE